MYTNGTPRIGNGIKIIPVAFQTEAGVATFAGSAAVESSGMLLDFAIKFDGTTPPNSLTYAVTDKDGLTIKAATITASMGRVNLDLSIPVHGVEMALSGNTTNGAKGTAFFYFLE